MQTKVWTLGKKLAGNLIPLAFATPFAILGSLEILKEPNLILSNALLWFALVPVVGWNAVNLFGLFGNRKMRTTLARRLEQVGHRAPIEKFFVGIATPSFHSTLDAHEDVGFLLLYPDSLQFWGDSKEIEIDRKNIVRIQKRLNIHTLLGLGGWIAIDGVMDGKPIRLCIEPRERDTLLGNSRLRGKFAARLQLWLKDGQ